MSVENEKTSNSAAVNFLGRVMREQPEILEQLSPRVAYILFSYSDPTTSRTLKELGETLGLTEGGVRVIYVRSVKQVFEKASPEIQESTPIITIFDAAKQTSSASRARRSLASTEVWADPERRSRISEALKGRKHSPDTRERMSEAQKRRFEDPEERAKASERRKGRKPSFKTRLRMSEVSQRTWQDPEIRQRRVDGLRKPETRQRISKANKGGTLSPIKRELLSESLRERWQDPEYRERMINNFRGRKKSPEAKAKIGKANREHAQTPQGKASRRENAEKQWQDPEFRERMARLGRERWEDPDFRARMLETRRGRKPPSPETRAKISESLKRRNDPDTPLWTYAQEHGLISVITERGLMSPRDLRLLERYFQGEIDQDKAQRVLNKFSKLVANLA